ncbi:MAG TPA: DUF6390 family protein [Candidatus Limnocylindrales bacterium]|nr:DUF6390 family protein [Candidatus Limnocylindrales bacterium]
MHAATGPSPDPQRVERRAPPSGPVLFARYAYSPNRLGLCGPDDADALFGEASGRGDDRELRRLAQGFEGAYPYLRLIASANRIEDPLDARVVDAYWLGSPLLDRVTPQLFADSLRLRFRPRLRSAAWRWLEGAAPAGGKPVHAFHVLDVFPKVGLMRGEHADRVVETMDACRVRWGRVVEVVGDQLVVNVVPLRLVAGQLELGPPEVRRVTAWRSGTGFIDNVTTGDFVSVHWDWACDVLDPDALGRLVAWTRSQLVVANQTL